MNFRVTLALGLLCALAPWLCGADYVIRNVRVFDGERMHEKRTVAISDGHIATTARPGAEVIDGAGRTLLPGLIDAHVHLPVFSPQAALEQSLAFGVTTVIVMWTSPPPRNFTGTPAIAILKGFEASDPPDQADLRTAGTGATAQGGHPTHMDAGGVALATPTIDTPAEAPAFVAARLAEGSDFIKIIYEDTNAANGQKLPTLNEAMIAALAAAAHAHGKLAVAHIGTEREAEGAITAGVDGLAHIFTGPSVSPEFIRLAVRSHVFVIPTLAILYSACGMSDGPAILKDERIMSRVKEQFRVTLGMSGYGNHYSCEGSRAAVRLLAQAHVPLVAGTDSPGPGTTYGASLHWELEHMVDAGLTPTAALATATSVAAQKFRMTDRGRIEPGMRADLLLVDGDPSKDIRATRNIVRVWKKGVALAH